MNFLVILFLCIFGASALANPQPEYDKKIIYCPEQVECKDDHCTGIGNNNEYFKHSYISSEFFQEGTYYFTGVGYKVRIEPYSSPMYTRCLYINKSPFKNNVSLIAKNGFNFEPLMENWSKWQVVGAIPRKNSLCSNDTPSLCPLIEKNEILIDSIIRKKVNREEYEYRGDHLAIDLATENGAPVNTTPIDVFTNDVIKLDYDTAVEACGNANRCKIYIRVRTKDKHGNPLSHAYIGEILVDLQNIMRIVSLSPLSGTAYTMTFNPPMNNTIIFHLK